MLRILMILSFICSLDLLSARPADEPTKFILGNIQNNVIPSRLEEAQELLERVFDAIRIGRGKFINSIVLTRNIITNRAEQINSEFRNNTDSLKSNKSQSRRSILIPISTTPRSVFFPPQETVRLENETAQGILERRKPDNIRQILDSVLTPKPLLDRTKEEEKYGNSGDKFIGVGRGIINFYEYFSNLANNILDYPVNAAKQASKGITRALNEIGAQLLGLQ
ncbi:uncharacterized protein LOC105428322 isoform X1 [Pogonomyrmex barbatus]|uniref:Uncharacterized protein LOC105428322 isoform X1 n=1 Tax=Pogonomyrmex barbatus TaxID=144034 RepID=A0A6I9WDC0_9HYME|nr:uncharacterized protein LOC105428322 isoform X1 [Pogonomyrmex barbatus]XP_011638877.1 uncharacterized protein LOC105428322 isoform X1 [Pogonomyrmex barbatus]